MTYGVNLIDKQDIHGRTCLYYCILFDNNNALDLITNYYLDKNNKDEYQSEFIDIEKIKDKNGDNIISYCFKENKKIF